VCLPPRQCWQTEDGGGYGERLRENSHVVYSASPSTEIFTYFI
ncbi:uncharacterized protein METZ01_LOCUS173926, partial [marine metagenome]